jgi:hypothetical protein
MPFTGILSSDKLYFHRQWRLKYLENNMLQLYLPQNYYFGDDFYIFFLQNFLKPFLRKKIGPMPIVFGFKAI